MSVVIESATELKGQLCCVVLRNKFSGFVTGACTELTISVQQTRHKWNQTALLPGLGVYRIYRIHLGACRFFSVHKAPHHSVSASDRQLDPPRVPGRGSPNVETTGAYTSQNYVLNSV